LFWFKAEQQSPSLNPNIGSRANQEKWIKLKDDARKLAREEWCSFKLDCSNIGFLGMYWGEGSKTGPVPSTIFAS